MTAQAQKDLQAIVDRLGPNMWLVLDEVAFPEERCNYSLNGRVLTASDCRLAGRYVRAG